MQRTYLIELGGEKEVYEMGALELTNCDDAILWIIADLECDAEYYNYQIKCKTYLQSYEEYEDEMHFSATYLISIEADDEIGIEVNDDEDSDIETIIETSLSVVSRIKSKMVEV